MIKVLLVTGSRALEQLQAVRPKAHADLQQLIMALPDNSIVVSGDARGPDDWSRTIAMNRYLTHVCYDRYGERVAMRYATQPSGRMRAEITDHRHWTNDAEAHTPEQWKELLLRRDRVMVHEIVKAHEEKKIEASVVALIASWSRTHGTEYTANKAEKSGLKVERLWYDP